ncbi:vacuolar protein sorting-associated protein 53-like protein [Vairimorpha necatrix]|uniref:Vacuolar protein sorting-associated protein 53-like protein n=1 Tax=Vairimorpha necatrix TaxID=6039 RepID=A0AAX4JDT5_9MICR
MENEYEECRTLEKGKEYEKILEKINKEISNIKSKGINFQDISNLKSYIEDETRNKIFKKKGIPSYFFKIIILLGYEDEIKLKINNLLISEYVTDFQLFISSEFKRLSDIKKYYKKLKNLIENLENIYFNLPASWDTKKEILNEIYLIIKQKICDIIFFNDFDKIDYLECVEKVLENEKKICEFLQDKKKSIFHLLAPFLKNYFESKFDKENIDIKKTEMKIFTNFVNFFQNFQNLYEKIQYFNNIESIKKLSESFEIHLIFLLNQMSKNDLNLDYELYKKDFVKIIVSLNTISYLNDCVSGLNSNLFCEYKINISQDLFIKLGNIENQFNGMLEIYIRNLLYNVNFNKKKISCEIIKIFKENIFFIDLVELSEDLKTNLVEIIILNILSRIYLLDFDEESSEYLIYDLHDLKNFIKQYFNNLGSFKILESYLKIFMCSTEDRFSFIENFQILSNNIFSFRQVVWSLKDKNCVIDLLEYFEQMETVKKIE